MSDNSVNWREKLTSSEYHICREKGTEPAFSGCYYDTKIQGTYVCKCCDEPLFTSDSKYDSGSGWPSFYQPLTQNAILEESDTSYGMVRIEAMCRSCGSHLGHVFPDGPAPTGLRYCINSASLYLRPDSPDNDS